jgi:hypothetical protein
LVSFKNFACLALRVRVERGKTSKHEVDGRAIAHNIDCTHFICTTNLLDIVANILQDIIRPFHVPCKTFNTLSSHLDIYKGKGKKM